MSAIQSEINATVHMVDSVLRDLDQLVRDATPEDLHFQDALTCREYLNEANGNLRTIREALDNLIAERMDTYQVGNVKRHRKTSRREWEHDNLLRLVLDSRVVNPETGEVESQVDCLKAVYGCKGYQASIRELERRKIQVDEFCKVDDRGWQLEVR